jgi:stearoyl-CoA desaturase (delta-9 desaturase)
MADPNVYCRNLVHDPIVVFVSRTFLLWVVLSLLIPYAIGGWSGLLWAGLVRIFLVHHVTWSVNSICHTFGMREFETTDQSRNEWIVGLLAFGEGWHNNHHAFPRSAFHGLHWWQFDLSGYLIRLLERVGLATEVYRIPAEKLVKRYKKVGESFNTTTASQLEEAVLR